MLASKPLQIFNPTYRSLHLFKSPNMSLNNFKKYSNRPTTNACNYSKLKLLNYSLLHQFRRNIVSSTTKKSIGKSSKFISALNKNFFVRRFRNVLEYIAMPIFYMSLGMVLYRYYHQYNYRDFYFWLCLSKILFMYWMNESNHEFCGKTLLKLCQNNGGVYTKIGQHLAAMAHVIPTEITAHLKSLQEECPKQPIENILKVLESELDEKKLKEISDIVAEPVGTASIAQVHKAKLNGHEVVIKVQHIDIAENAENDIKLLTWACNVIKQSKLFGHKFNLHWLVKELGVLIEDEINFIKEASNATEAKRNHGHLPWLVIPRVYQEYTTKRVLIMDYEEGSSVDDVNFYEQENVDPRVIIDRISYLFNEMIFIKGFLHSDPHAGNLRVRKCGPIGPVQIILLDHGQYKRLNSVFHHNYCNFLNAIMTSDAPNILKYAANLDIKKESLAKQLACMMTGMSWEQIENSTMVVSGRSHDSTWGSKDGKTKELVERHLDKALEILETIPPELTIIMKSNDLIRCLEHKLTDGTSPEVYLNLAILCLQGMKKLEYNNSVSVSLFPGFNRFLLELSYIPSMASMYLARSWILAKKSVYRRYNNYAIFFGGFFFDMSHRKMKKGHGRA